MTKNNKLIYRKQTQIKISPIKVHDFCEIFKKYSELRVAGLGNYLAFAYNIIFSQLVQTPFEIILTDEQLKKINLLLLAAEKLMNERLDDTMDILYCYTQKIQTSEDSYITYISNLDIFIQAAENNFLNALINKAKKTNFPSIMQQQGSDRSSRKRRIENNYGTKTYKMKAALVFYLIPILVKALEAKDIKNYGHLIHSIHKICFDIEREMPQHIGGTAVHNTEQNLQQLYKDFYKEYKEYNQEVFTYFDWKAYADSNYIKQEFLKHAESDKTELSKNVFDGYEIDCLQRKILNK